MNKQTFVICKHCGMDINKEKDIYKHTSKKLDHDLYLLVVQAYEG